MKIVNNIKNNKGLLGMFGTGGGKTIGIVGAVGSVHYVGSVFSDKKRRKIVISDESFQQALKIKNESKDSYIDANELAKDIELRKRDAKDVKSFIQNLESNNKKD